PPQADIMVSSNDIDSHFLVVLNICCFIFTCFSFLLVFFRVHYQTCGDEICLGFTVFDSLLCSIKNNVI
ncbi:MAG: hypothetical protein OQK03_01640, partial [Colwellia sp.]|nr:hypothetical protein [Colwellia sp.]